MWATRTVSRILSAAKPRTAIYLGQSLPTGSSTRPAPIPVDTGVDGNRRPRLLALARSGVCHALAVTGQAVRSYRTVSPLPRTPEGAVRRFTFCCTVPHARPRARVAVSHHCVQSCPDFPPQAVRLAAAVCPRRDGSSAWRTPTQSFFDRRRMTSQKQPRDPSSARIARSKSCQINSKCAVWQLGSVVRPKCRSRIQRAMITQPEWL